MMKIFTAAELIEKAKPVFPRADMEHFKLNISEKIRENLEKLATYLYALPDDYEKFNMGSWADDCTGENIYVPSEAVNCGTVACAAGHAVWVVEKPIKRDVHWHAYVERVLTGDDYHLEEWAFAASWQEVDNTPQGAAKRIFYALQHGVPSNYEMQMSGDNKLCY